MNLSIIEQDTQVGNAKEFFYLLCLFKERKTQVKLYYIYFKIKLQ